MIYSPHHKIEKKLCYFITLEKKLCYFITLPMVTIFVDSATYVCYKVAIFGNDLS